MSIKKSDLILLAIAILLLPLYFFIDPSTFAYFPKCPFLFITHLECPGCGSQRAIHQLLHLNVAGALKLNLLLVLFLPLLTSHFILSVISYFSKKEYRINLLYHKTTPYIIFTITLIFWILRNTAFYQQWVNHTLI
jgi:hypothetical protein